VKTELYYFTDSLFPPAQKTLNKLPKKKTDRFFIPFFYTNNAYKKNYRQAEMPCNKAF
jgi:hypothetical protein